MLFASLQLPRDMGTLKRFPTTIRYQLNKFYFSTGPVARRGLVHSHHSGQTIAFMERDANSGTDGYGAIHTCDDG